MNPGTTKNDEGRVFPFTQELRELLVLQKEETEQLQRQQDMLMPWVLHREGKKLGDFRRTAVRNLVRAGIPERVVMQMTGHKTRSVFERYNIVSETDLMEAAKRLDKMSAGRVG